jgi:ligand-binding SRPBCC domain-containing protein
MHTHSFEEAKGGTTVGDSVEFDAPFSFAIGWFVMRDVRQIFAFRRQALIERFGATLAPGP